jgi:hypothetical protein
MLVPDEIAYDEPGQVLMMLLPGAAKSTVVAPKLLKLARASDSSEAATAMMLGDEKFDG